ncbi:MAG: DUF4369 domain-containing protein [Flavobacteriales bacterium]|nr:DUF4369 domain-containing protein [Flavobacteriales bacterium]
MIKKIFIVLVAVMSFYSCSKSGNTQISGEIRGAKNGVLYVMSEQEDGTMNVLDSLNMKKDGKFSFSLDVPSTQLCYLTFDKNIPTLAFFVEGVPVEILAQVDSLSFADVKGGENQGFYNEFLSYLKEFEAKKSDLYIKVLKHSAENGNKDSLAEYSRQYNTNIRRQAQYIANFALTHAQNEVSPLVATSFLTQNGYSPILDSISSAMTPQVKESIYGKEYTDFISRAKKSSIGQVAPAFEIVKDSTTYSYDTYKGKNLFIAMWTPGQNASREYMLSLEKEYIKWRDKGLEVLSVAMTKDTMQYEHDSYYLNMPWVDVIQSNTKTNSVIKQFALVGNFPMGILIDKNGILHARYIEPADLELILPAIEKK